MTTQGAGGAPPPPDARFPSPARRVLALVASIAIAATGSPPPRAAPLRGQRPELAELLPEAVLFVKRFNYLGIHIYDTYYKWRPGGGIYILESPTAPPERQRVRAVIDGSTPQSPGDGVYSDPDLDWDGERLLFCYKPSRDGSTSIWEIGVDGTGLRRLSDPEPTCVDYHGSHAGQHDVTPAYLPDGRILLTSTRPSGLVPCANEGVNILHVMDADGSNLHPISVNNVNEFDPCVMEDGRILFGRWEYVDKTALTQQSLWTISPDGTGETALFANNLVRPEALLDARPVPGEASLFVASLTRHNAPPRGCVAFIDPTLGKNAPEAITNLDRPESPTTDTGDSCDPWPLSRDAILYSAKPKGAAHNALVVATRSGGRIVIHSDPAIDCHSPIPLRPRRRPPVLSSRVRSDQATGRFFVQDIYRGLTGVERGEVKWLRVIEETSRVSGTPGGAYNQTFLLSAALAFSVKNFLGRVPVEEDGSAYFEVPSGRAIYLQALDAEGRLVQSMRTFVQAAPGVTRSCIGCHEHKLSTPPITAPRAVLGREARRLEPESWGSGFIDFPSMVQPIFNRRCVRCHGGEEGFGGGLDLSGGWTEHFSIAYENLVSRRETQLTAYLIAGIDCMNGTSLWSARIFPPRAHGSGAAPLARRLVEGHEGRIEDLERSERDLLLAWIDTNGLYHGTWDYSQSGCSIASWKETRDELTAEMASAGCLGCHGKGGRLSYFENDWFNLRRPRWSRLLRAPLAPGGEGHGAALCRDRPVDPRRQRIRLLRTGGYLHAVTPLASFAPRARASAPEDGGAPVISFASTDDPHYRAMLEVIRRGRRRALARPRVDMPGARVIAGRCRQFRPPALPDHLAEPRARVDADGIVHLAWERSARTIGLEAEVHRSRSAGFTPDATTRIASSAIHSYRDETATAGRWHYAVVLRSGERRAAPARVAVTVPAPHPPGSPTALKARGEPGRVELEWEGDDLGRLRYLVDRRAPEGGAPERLTSEPVADPRFEDATALASVPYRYTVRAVDRRGAASPPSSPAVAAARPERREPLFAAFTADAGALDLESGAPLPPSLHGGARVAGATLDLARGGHATFPHRSGFDLSGRFSLACRVKITGEASMPVVVSCGQWREAGWFLQRIGSGWRWHVGGIDCDGGAPAPGRWTSLAGTFDGRVARLWQDGRLVGEKAGSAVLERWPGPLHVGQYSGGPGPEYQVRGRVAEVRIWRRVLPEAEVEALARDAR